MTVLLTKPTDVFLDTMEDYIVALDAIMPDWHERVDTNTLNIDDVNYCVLGQVFGDYWLGLITLARYGFSPRFKYCITERTHEQEWVDVIETRQGA